jgi:hypothetical protein
MGLSLWKRNHYRFAERVCLSGHKLQRRVKGVGISQEEGVERGGCGGCLCVCI